MRLRAALAALCGIGALAGLALGPSTPAQPGPTESGRQLYVEGCSSCHGMDARGVPGRGPTLRGVGAAAADFYLRTGRMPLADSKDQPERSDSPYTAGEIRALVDYVASFGGPPIPRVDPRRGTVSEGYQVFSDHCMGCHQVVGQGGITTQGVAPELRKSKPVDVAEAITVGPYVMPRFTDQLSRQEIASVARYVDYTKHPDDRGGWGIGHIGPVPEGMVTWLLALFALVLTIRLLGERTS